METQVVQLALAIQEYNKFVILLKESGSDDILQDSIVTLKKLQLQKSQLEGSAAPISDDPGFGQILKHPRNSFLQLKSHVKGNSLSEIHKHVNVKEAILKDLREALGNENDLLFVSLSCSPWFAHTQDDRQSKGRKNSLFFVYRHHTRNSLGIENQHSSRRHELFSVDGPDEWIIGREIRSFIDLLLKNQYPYVAALANKGNVLFASETWDSLCSLTSNGNEFLHTKGFLQRTSSQAISLISVRDKKQRPKNKKNKKKFSAADTHIMSSDAQQDVNYFCECFKLLFAVANICAGHELPDWEEWERVWPSTPPSVTFPDEPTKETIEITMKQLHPLVRFHLCQTTYKSCRESDSYLYDIAFKIFDMIDQYQKKFLSNFSFNVTSSVEDKLKNWLSKLRLQHISSELDSLIYPISFDCVRLNENQIDNEGLCCLMKEIGPPLVEFHSSQVLFLIENGSRMYDVSMPDSDRDYIAVYQANCPELLSLLQWPKESADNRGLQYDIEHCCYEVRMFCELLLKGNPSVIELLFSERASYMNGAWKKLIEHREHFVTEAVVFQYVSWVEFHLRLIKNGRNPTKASKYFYHAFHKLFELKRLLNKQPIQVKSIGAEKEFILRIRSSPLVDDISIENLTKQAETQLKDLVHKLAKRNWRYRESGDWQFLQHWLWSIRYHSLSQNNE